MRGADIAVFHWINGWASAFAPFYVYLSEGNKQLGFRVALALVAIALIVAGPQTRKAAILALVAFPLANGLTDIFKHLLPMDRPCVELKDAILYVGKLGSSGTASAHAANTAAVAFVFTSFLRWWGVLPIALSLFTGLARIYVGVHYPSQVLLGWICGASVGALVVFAYGKVKWKFGHKEEAGEPAGDIGA